MSHHHLQRLSSYFTSTPLFFVTTCTNNRQPVLANESAFAILKEEWSASCKRHGWRIGRFMVMPDHVHFFCCPDPEMQKKTLPQYIGSWKEWTSKRIKKGTELTAAVWQKQFFDHVLRSRESYAEKWFYTRENPVRANLVGNHEEWPWQGFVDFDEP